MNPKEFDQLRDKHRFRFRYDAANYELILTMPSELHSRISRAINAWWCSLVHPEMEGGPIPCQFKGFPFAAWEHEVDLTTRKKVPDLTFSWQYRRYREEVVAVEIGVSEPTDRLHEDTINLLWRSTSSISAVILMETAPVAAGEAKVDKPRPRRQGTTTARQGGVPLSTSFVPATRTVQELSSDEE